MFDNNATIALGLAAVFLASMAIPTAAAEPTRDLDPETGNDTVDCIITHLEAGWFVGNCLSATQSAGPSETLECIGEHLKNGWFVGNCLH